MKQTYRQKPSHRQKLRTRFVLVSGAAIVMLTFTMGWLIFLNISLNTKIKASAAVSGGSSLSDGNIISEFTWEHNPPTKATIGPDAIKVSDGAHTASGGRASTGGLAPGASAKDINLEIPSSPIFDAEGIDISIDFKRHELPAKGSSYHDIQSGSFFTRGKSLDFGFKKGIITISYRLVSPKGQFVVINETTNYEIPTDEQFRNYRFIYNPVTGKAEIFVDNVIVWSHSNSQSNANSTEVLSTGPQAQIYSVYWAGAGNIMIGKGIDGGGMDSPVFDNLVIRAIAITAHETESLINYMLENSADGVLIYWSTIVNGDVDFFAIDRSTNGIDFSNIESILAKKDEQTMADYTYEDKSVPGPGTYFYRLRQVFKEEKQSMNGPSSEVLSAIKIKPFKTLSIDKVSPDIFQTTFNLFYYTPSPGRVWVQLIDESGKTKSSETFEAQQGRNIYFFKDKNNLAAGDYTLHLIQNDKRVAAKVTKVPVDFEVKKD